MTDKFQTLYKILLEELADDLKKAEDIYLEISQNILSCLADSAEVVHNKKLQLLEETYQQKISGLLANLGKIYQGNIEIFPIPENAGLLQRMEISNRQAEELENILNQLFKQNSIKTPNYRMIEKEIPPIRQSVCHCSCSEPLPEEDETLPAILVCGHYNTGKTSLIQAVTQLNITNNDSDIAITETDAAVFIDSSDTDFEKSDIRSYAEMIFDRSYDLTDSSLIESINCIWYCIDGSSMQLSKQDKDLICRFHDNMLLVVTKCDLMQKEQIQILMNSLTELVDKEQIVMVSSEDGNGLLRLVDKTQKLCSKSLKNKKFRKTWNSFFKDKSESWQSFMSDEADCYISWAENRVAANSDILETETTALICKIAVIYGIVINSRVITALKKCVEKTSAPEEFIRKIGQAAKCRFESDMTLNKTTSSKQIHPGKQILSRRVKQK